MRGSGLVRFFLWAVSLFGLAAPLWAGEEAQTPVVYVPESHLLTDWQRVSLLGWVTDRQYQAGRSKAEKALGAVVGSADVVADLLREMACPTAVSAEECKEVVVVPEKELDTYLASVASGAVRVVRVSGMELSRKLYQIVVGVTLADGGQLSRKHAAATYIDWDATPESAKADYRASLREIAEMLDYGLSLEYQNGQRNAPAEWSEKPTLKQLKVPGELRCVKNLIGDRVVRVGESRAWIGAVNASGPQVTSLKWVRCR